MQRFSRLQPGISVGHPNVTAGTLGLVVKDDRSGRPAILSNWHVLAGSASATPGDATIQPGSFDGGRVPRDTVAALERMILDKGGDAAIALLTNARSHDLSICDLGKVVKSIKETNIGDIVVKSGRTTQVTKGRVDGKGRLFSTTPSAELVLMGLLSFRLTARIPIMLRHP
jgi:endonuclease G